MELGAPDITLLIEIIDELFFNLFFSLFAESVSGLGNEIIILSTDCLLFKSCNDSFLTNLNSDCLLEDIDNTLFLISPKDDLPLTVLIDSLSPVSFFEEVNNELSLNLDLDDFKLDIVFVLKTLN